MAPRPKVRLHPRYAACYLPGLPNFVTLTNGTVVDIGELSDLDVRDIAEQWGMALNRHYWKRRERLKKRDKETP